MDSPDYYGVLGLKPGATNAQIDEAYRQIYADDLTGQMVLTDNERYQFSDAYRVLSSRESREQYDAELGLKPPPRPAPRPLTRPTPLTVRPVADGVHAAQLLKAVRHRQDIGLAIAGDEAKLVVNLGRYFGLTAAELKLE